MTDPLPPIQSDLPIKQVLRPDGTLDEPLPQELEPLLQAYQQGQMTLESLMQAVQDRLGHLPDRWMRHVAVQAGMTRLQLQRWITLHPEWRTHPPGRHVIRVCRAESCTDEGSARIMAGLEQWLHLEADHTTADGKLSLETVYCLGHCEGAAVVALDDVIHHQMDVDQTLARVKCWLREIEGKEEPTA